MQKEVFRALLGLYPRQYRAVFATEMMETFELAAADRRSCSLARRALFAFGELTGLLHGLCNQWIAKWTSQDSYITARCQSQGQASLLEEVAETQKRLLYLIQRLEFAIANHDFPGARRYCEEEQAVREELQRLVVQYRLNLPPNPQSC